MNPLRILHAENDKVQAELLARVIHRVLTPMLSVGIEIKVVSTLREMLAHTHDHDATIVDLHLDDAGEQEIIGSFRNLREPIIVMTGIQDSRLERICKEAGATEVFVKAAFNEDNFCLAIVKSFRHALEHAA